MATRLTLYGLLGGLFALSLMAVSLAREPSLPAAFKILPTLPKSSAPAYPVVIRIGKAALEPLANRKIALQGKVDTVVLGTRAIGTSQTNGEISLQTLSNRDEASFNLLFTGKTRSCTVGTNGPALIYSHSDTKFVCTKRISLHPQTGFVDGTTNINAETTLVFDGFESSRGRLGRRIICRVAERRALESSEEARQIADRDTQAELQLAFDKEIGTQLTVLNQRLQWSRYMKLVGGESTKIQLASCSSSDCLHVGIGKEGIRSKLTSMPPKRESLAPIEVWVHSSLLGEPISQLMSLSESKLALPDPLKLELLKVLGLSLGEATGIVDVAIAESWLVVGLKSGESTVASAPQVNQQAVAKAPLCVARQ